MKLPGTSVWEPLSVNWPIKKDDQLAAEVIKRNLMTRNTTEGQKKYSYGLWCPSACSAGRLEVILCPWEGMAWNLTPCFRSRFAWWGMVWKGWVLPGEKKCFSKFVKTRSEEQPSLLSQRFVLSSLLALLSRVSHPEQCVWSHMMVMLLQQLLPMCLHKSMRNL